MVIYSQRVAAKLMLKGFVLQGLGRNKSNKDKNVFYFKDSNAIKQAICCLLQNKSAELCKEKMQSPALYLLSA